MKDFVILNDREIVNIKTIRRVVFEGFLWPSGTTDDEKVKLAPTTNIGDIYLLMANGERMVIYPGVAVDKDGIESFNKSHKIFKMLAEELDAGFLLEGNWSPDLKPNEF